MTKGTSLNQQKCVIYGRDESMHADQLKSKKKRSKCVREVTGTDTSGLSGTQNC